MHKHPFFILIVSLVLFTALYAWISPFFREGKTPPPVKQAATEVHQVENFRLLDHEGRSHELYDYSDSSAIVLISHGTECPILQKSIPKVNRLAEEFHSQRVTFAFLNALPQDDRATLVAHVKEYGIKIPILKDDAQIIAEGLQIERTAEAILINPQNWEIVYRGAIDDQLDYGAEAPGTSKNNFLANAIDSLMRGQKISTPKTGVKGCLISFPHQGETVSYADEVVPILRKNCLPCHYPGGAAPWAMENYEKILHWSPMIREVIRTQRMPPVFHDPFYGEFSSPIHLTPEAARKLAHWVEQKSPHDHAYDPLFDQESQRPEWLFGQPDHILSLPEQQIPESGVLDYRYIYLPATELAGKWLRAIYFKPSNTKVLHHAFIFLISPEEVSTLQTEGSTSVDRFGMQEFFAIWGPGYGFSTLPLKDNAGWKIPANKMLFVQLHYVTTGKAETDQTEIGFYFSPQRPEYEFKTTSAFTTDFSIPPNAKNYPVSAQHTFKEDTLLYAVIPHMHYRGRQITAKAVYPDGSQDILVSVPRYNFSLQAVYNFQEPKKLPAGTIIQCDGIFDNSPQNRVNPDPNATVTYGQNSSDEMLVCYMVYTRASQPMPISTDPAGVARETMVFKLAPALDLYKMDNQTFPTTEQGLKALVEKPTTEPAPPLWQGPYRKAGEIVDPWGNPYEYLSPGKINAEGFDLFSKGPNGTEDGAGGDDVVLGS